MIVWPRQTGSDVPSRVNLVILDTQANLVLTHGLHSMLPLFSVASTYTVDHHHTNSEFIGPRTCVPMPFTARSPPAQSQYSSTLGSSSNMCFLFRYPHGAISVGLLFSILTLRYSIGGDYKIAATIPLSGE